MGHGDISPYFRAFFLEPASTSGPRRSSRRRSCVRHRATLVVCWSRSASWGGDGAHSRGGPDVPLQQPRFVARPAPLWRRVCHYPRNREGVNAVAHLGFFPRRTWIYHEDDAGVPDRAGVGWCLLPGCTHHAVAAYPTARRGGRRNAGFCGVVGGGRHGGAGGRSSVHRGVSGQQPLEPDFRLQRLRPPYGQRVGQCRRRRRHRDQPLGPDRPDPSLRNRDGQPESPGSSRRPCSCWQSAW